MPRGGEETQLYAAQTENMEEKEHEGREISPYSTSSPKPLLEQPNYCTGLSFIGVLGATAGYGLSSVSLTPLLLSGLL